MAAAVVVSVALPWIGGKLAARGFYGCLLRSTKDILDLTETRNRDLTRIDLTEALGSIKVFQGSGVTLNDCRACWARGAGLLTSLFIARAKSLKLRLCSSCILTVRALSMELGLLRWLSDNQESGSKHAPPSHPDNYTSASGDDPLPAITAITLDIP